PAGFIASCCDASETHPSGRHVNDGTCPFRDSETFPRFLRAAESLDSVLCFRCLNGLPLHVAWRIGAAARQRHDVIDDVAGASVRIAALDLERVLGSRAPFHVSRRRCAVARLSLRSLHACRLGRKAATAPSTFGVTRAVPMRSTFRRERRRGTEREQRHNERDTDNAVHWPPKRWSASIGCRESGGSV